MGEPNLTTGTVPAPVRSGLSIKGLWEVIYKPAAFFKDIKQNPKILVPWIATFLGMLLFIHFARDLLVEMQVEQIMEQQNATRDQIPESAIELISKFIYVGAVFFALVPLVLAGLATLIGNFFMGAKAKFKQVLSVSLYGEWVFTVFTLVLLPLVIAKQSILVSLSPAALISEPSMTDPAYIFLSKLGLRYIWEVIAVGIGYAAVFDIQRNKGYVIAVISLGIMAIAQALQTILM